MKNPMDRRAWQATVHRSQRVRHDWSDLAQHIYIHKWKYEVLVRQEYCSGLQFLSPKDLPNQGIKPGFPAFRVNSLCLSQYRYIHILISCHHVCFDHEVSSLVLKLSVPLFQCSWATVTRYPRLGGLSNRNALSHSWRREIWNQGVC